jgi:hypothetical protein
MLIIQLIHYLCIFKVFIIMKIKITESQYVRLQEQRVKGEEVTPGKYVVHASNRRNRDSIMDYGIRTGLGDCYLSHAASEYSDEEECVPAVFATNSLKKKDMFDSTIGDDIWVIDTERANVQWYKDAHFDDEYKHIVTFDDIPKDSVKLIHKGDGQYTPYDNDETELTLSEMIKLDINVGDTIMGGKFKNKKIVVKTIDKNEKGDITINGKPLLRFRILKEDKYRLVRRESDMKHRIDNQLMMAKLQNDLHYVPLDHLILHIADNVAVEMANELNLDDDEYITFRNQIKQYIRSNFYEHIRDYWQSNQL